MKSQRILFSLTLLATLLVAVLFLNDLTVGQTKKKIGTDYTEETTPAANDYFHMVKSGGGAGTDRNVKFSSVPKALLASIANGHLVYNNNGVFGAPTITPPLTAANGAMGLAGLTTLGTATYVPRVNSGATAWEYRSPSQVLSDIGALTSTIPGSSTELLFRNSSTSLGATGVTWNAGSSILDVPGTIVTGTTSTANTSFYIKNNTAGSGLIRFDDGTSSGQVVYDHSTDTMTLATGGASRATISSSGLATSVKLQATNVSTEQLKLLYDVNNHLKVTTDSNAVVTYDATGTTPKHLFSDPIWTNGQYTYGDNANAFMLLSNGSGTQIGYGTGGSESKMIVGSGYGYFTANTSSKGGWNTNGMYTTGALRFNEPSGSGSNFTAFIAQAQAGDVTYTLPAADGTNGYQLTTNGAGTLSWATAGSGGGLTKFTEAESTSSPNGTVYVDSLTAAGASTNADAAIVPKGTGALLAAIPDSGTTGGNKRGTNAVDLQLVRGAATNVASGTCATISGGAANTASASYTSSIGGYSNTSSGSYASVLGGSTNTASGNQSLAGMGGNTASGQFSLALGSSSTASADYATVIGKQAISDKYGQHAQASGYFSTTGDAQTSVLTARNTTTNGLGGTSLKLNGSSERLTIPANTAWQADISIVAREAATGDCASWTFTCLITRDGSNNTSIPGSTSNMPYQTDYSGSGSAWTVSITADDTNEALQIGVTGESGKTIKWVSRIELTEVTG